MKKIITVCAVLVLLAVFCFSGLQLFGILQDYRAGEKTYDSIEQYVTLPEPTQQEKPRQPVTEQTPDRTPEEPAILWPEVDFAGLLEINPDVVGWLYIEGTQVNYPVLQGSDNDRYLNRLITGERNSAGSLFLDADGAPDLSGRNQTIYGHNMKNGSMFAGIMGYRSQEFYEAHPQALLLTPEKNYRVQIFSAYVLDADGDGWETSFTDTSFRDWLDTRISRSYISADVIPGVEDRVLTLSTCAYDTDDARFLVHGILIPE